MTARKQIVTTVGLLLLCLFALVGCLTVPLGDPEKSTVDDKLVGWWLTKSDSAGAHVVALVQKLDHHSYLIWQYDCTLDGQGPRAKGWPPYHAWLTQVGAVRFLTVKSMSPLFDLPSNHDKERYVLFRVDQTRDGLELRTVEESIVKDPATPDALMKKLADNVENKALYSPETSLTFQHPSDAEMAQVEIAIKPNLAEYFGFKLNKGANDDDSK